MNEVGPHGAAASRVDPAGAPELATAGRRWSPHVADLVGLAAQASPAAVELARAVLTQDVSDAAWAQQLGPALTQSDAARLLGKSEQAVRKDARLLRIHNRDGRPVYPVVQFDGRHQLPGLGDVVLTLRGTLDPLTVASWLTTPEPDLDGQPPIVALRTGRRRQVLGAARRLAADAT